MTNITKLTLCFNKIITYEDIKGLTCITSLDLSYNENITNEQAKNFKKLKELIRDD